MVPPTQAPVELEVVAAGRRADLAQLGMDERAVVALVVVLEDDLPVAVQVVVVAGQRDEPLRPVGGDQVVQGPDVLGERRGVARPVDEQEPVPALQRQLDQAVLGRAEVGVLPEPGRDPQGCRPGRRSRRGRGRARSAWWSRSPDAEQLVAAVPAGVGERPHRPVGPPGQQHPGPRRPCTARWAPVCSRSPSRPTQVQDPAKKRSCSKANTRGET